MYSGFTRKMTAARVAVALAAVGGCGLAAAPAMAASDYANTLQALQQQEFRELSKELGGAVAFKGVVPAEGLGGIRAHKGLPGNVDVDAFYNKATNNIGVWGAGVRWAFIEGSTVMPAVAIRGSYSALSGVDQLKMNTTGVDLSISKGILMFTPYAGVGKVWVRSTPKDVPGLKRESFSLNRAFAGVNINLGINLAAEVDRTGDTTSYSVKAGIRF